MLGSENNYYLCSINAASSATGIAYRTMKTYQDMARLLIPINKQGGGLTLVKTLRFLSLPLLLILPSLLVAACSNDPDDDPQSLTRSAADSTAVDSAKVGIVLTEDTAWAGTIIYQPDSVAGGLNCDDELGDDDFS